MTRQEGHFKSKPGNIATYLQQINDLFLPDLKKILVHYYKIYSYYGGTTRRPLENAVPPPTET